MKITVEAPSNGIVQRNTKYKPVMDKLLDLPMGEWLKIEDVTPKEIASIRNILRNKRAQLPFTATAFQQDATLFIHKQELTTNGTH